VPTTPNITEQIFLAFFLYPRHSSSRSLHTLVLYVLSFPRHTIHLLRKSVCTNELEFALFAATLTDCSLHFVFFFEPHLSIVVYCRYRQCRCNEIVPFNFLDDSRSNPDRRFTVGGCCVRGSW
jgi:hypothetical protein